MNKQIVFAGCMVAAVVCLAMAPALMAQQPQRPTPEIMVQNIEKAVTLTADQKAKILKIYTDAVANAQQGGRGGFFGGGATTEAVEKVLTPDQVKKLRAYTLQQSIDRRINQIDQAVTLTAEQKTKIKPVIETEITAQNKLMAEQRALGDKADPEAMRTKRTEIRGATDKALESILTKDQLEKYKAMPRRGMRGQ
jgi:Spy/CpxP family protein refolding chaperone